MRPALLLVLALLVAGCGGERSFEAQEFVDEVNSHGAGLVLDGPLANVQEGVEVFEVSFAEEEEPAGGKGSERDGHEHGGGSLVIAEDAEAATAEHRRCEGAVSFLCYRAANAVLILEDEADPDELDRVVGAIRELESD